MAQMLQGLVSLGHKSQNSGENIVEMNDINKFS